METEFCQARGGVDCVVDYLQDTASPEDGMNALQAFCGIIIVAGMSFAVSKRPSSPTEHIRRGVHYIYDRCLTSLLTIWPFLPKEGRPTNLAAYVVPQDGAAQDLAHILSNDPKSSGKVALDEEDLLRVLSTSIGTDKRMTLVLDLDETLVHATHDYEEKPMEADFRIFDDETHQYFKVWKRPFLDLFLEHASKMYEIVIYTASYACYADPIIDSIDRRCTVAKRLYNTSVVQTGKDRYEKDLSLANAEHFPRRLVMIDNSPTVCKTHAENLIVIESFQATNPADDALLRLIPFLQALAVVDDVRSVLHRKKYVEMSFRPGLLCRGEPATPVIELEPVVAALDNPPLAMAMMDDGTDDGYHDDE